VIDALQYLPDARLLVIGDGPVRADAEKKIASMGMGNRVTFLGWLPTLEAVLDAILTSRTFVMPSSSEGGPRSALEAMACGMPVIATRVGVMPEVIEDGENGLFTDGSPKDIATKVGILLRDEEKRECMGKAARKILDRFERGHMRNFLRESPKGDKLLYCSCRATSHHHSARQSDRLHSRIFSWLASGIRRAWHQRYGDRSAGGNPQSSEKYPRVFFGKGEWHWTLFSDFALLEDYFPGIAFL
jgi:glycogen synthase